MKLEETRKIRNMFKIFPQPMIERKNWVGESVFRIRKYLFTDLDPRIRNLSQLITDPDPTWSFLWPLKQ
jgi:hypothetical protein